LHAISFGKFFSVNLIVSGNLSDTLKYRIRYGDAVAECQPKETVLKALLRSGIKIPYSCGSGLCLTCITKVVDGKIDPGSQIGIKDAMCEQGYFLPCVCEPREDLTIAPPEDAALFGRAMVTDVMHLSDAVCRVRLMTATPLYYHAGQFVNLRRADGLTRAYSLSSVPSLDRHLELQIKRLPHGGMSNWIYYDMKPGDALDIQGPNGSCFYVPGNRAQPLLLVGNGSGLSPLLGIARDALADGHTGNIHLYHGTRVSSGLYLDDALRQLAREHENFLYTPCLSREDTAETRYGRAEEAALADHPDLSGWRVYLCGYPPMVHDTQRRAILAGAASPDVFIDPFELRDLRKKPRD
jgi:NAD(P)H-flavin reductase/ferredoxin